MENNPQNRLILAREKFKAGEIDKFQYAECLNQQHRRLFDYPTFLAGTDVAEVRLTAEGVSVRSAAHDISMLVDAVDLHATPYALLGFGNYETDETSFLKSVFRAGDVFLDIGANLGWYSLVLGRNCPGAQIYAFEPITSTVEVLKKNIALNRLDNVEAVGMGMFNEEGEFNFLFAPDVSGATSLKLVGQSRGDEAVRNVVCKVTTLDAFCNKHGITPALLKIDVEGAELMVVQGGACVLRGTPIILMELLRKWSREFGYHPNDVLGLLGDYGYRAWAFNKSGKLEICPRVTEETTQTNFVFMHPLKHADIIQLWQQP
ncbi:FkbM family methyltransferase [Pseudomonas asiatica]|uniref:FkbM family methyltransferase n=1 Tax=Pseudomonas asiatica TaxID=2219225 RepID=UPI002368703F|nr:FkbM family methyltransferase [Pseudomonas asiatica]WDM87924.1 FkbM family methyltransferase [Pseudomonas asiatica]